MDCIFCKIAAGEIPADVVYQDEELIAFRDIQPQAPKHIVIISRTHIISIAQLIEEQQELIGHLILVARDIAEKESISNSGYRLTTNCGADAGQLVPHLHFHLLGGRRLSDELA